MSKKLTFLVIIGAFFSSIQAQESPYITMKKNQTEMVFGIADVKEAHYLCDLKELGFLINSVNGSIITFQLPKDKVDQVSRIDYFNSVSISNVNNSASAQNFAALKQSKVDKVHQGTSNQLTTNYSGQGVIIGIVDIGFQTDHPTFFNTEGTQYRVSRFWDQTDQTGIAPAGYSYGKECADSLSIINQIDFDGSHGTHVAGIAGGSGYSSKDLVHKGVAHESELVFVKILHTNDSLGKSSLGDAIVANPTIIDAYNYIFDYATSQGKPAVLNLSWGSHTGPHDGTSLFDKAVDQMVTVPGHIIVGSNGNNGRTEMHFKHEFSNFDTVRTIPYERSRGWRSNESVYVDIWGSPNTPFQFKVHLYDSFGSKLASTPFYNSATSQSGVSYLHSGLDTLHYTLEIQESYIHNQKPNMLFYSLHSNPKKFFIVMEMVAEKGRIDAWNSGDAYRWGGGGFAQDMGPVQFDASFKKGDVTHTMGENGGTGKGTISVGAYINRNVWVNFDGNLTDNSSEYDAGDIAGFSSEGPTVDGRVKPDISAPGQGITSAINRHAYNPFPNRNRDNLMDSTNFNGTANYWLMQSGTSMSGPHVAGIVALMLEANPNLTSEEIRAILIKTAVQDNFTGSTPNMKWGHGKVDALAALKEAELSLGLNNLNQAKVKLYPNPALNVLHIESEEKFMSYTIYNLQGVMIQAGSLVENIDLSSLNSGIYLIQLAGAQQLTTARFTVIE